MAGDSAGGKEVGRISIRVVPNLDKFYRDLKAKLEEAEKGLEAKINVVPDMDAFREKVKAETARMDAKVKIAPEIEQSAFAKTLAEAKAAAKAANIKLDVDFRDAAAEAHLAELIAKLKAEAAAANIHLGVSATHNKGPLGDVNRLVQDLDTAGNAVEHTGQQFLGLTRMGWIVTAVFAAAAPAIGLVAGLLAGLPSLITAAALPMATLALGFKGIQAALDSSGILAEGKKGKQGPGAGLKQLQDAVGQVFKTGLTPVFDQLLTVMPILQTGFVGVAQSLVGLAQGFTNVVTSAVGMQQIQQIFANTSSFINGMTPILSTFVQTFLTLSAEGGKSFNLLLTPLQTFANQFNDMINRVAGNGVLQGAFQGLSTTLGSLLNLFTRLFEAGLQAMGQLGGPLASLINGLGDAFIALMPALTTLSAFIGNVGGALFRSLAPVIQALTPGFTALANTLGSTLTGALTALSPVLTQVANAISTSLVQALAQIAPLLPGVIQSFVTLGTAIANQLATYLPQLAVSFGQIVGVLAANGPALFQQLADAFIQLVPSVIQAVPGMVQLAASAAQLLTQIGPLLPQIVQLGDQLIQLAPSALAVVSAMAQVGGAFLTAVTSVGQFVSGVVSGVGQVLSEIGSLPGKIAAIFQGAVGLLVSAGKNLIQGLINGMESMIGAAVAKAQSIAGQIAGAVQGFFGIHSPSTLFAGFGVNLMEGLGQGMDAQGGSIVDKAKNLAQQIADAMSSGLNGPDLFNLESQIKPTLDQLKLQRDQLKVQLDNTTDTNQKAALRDQIKQIDATQDQLRLQKDTLGQSTDFGEAQKENKKFTDDLGQSFGKLVNIGTNFAMANVNQFENDLGMSGHGAVESIAGTGIQWATQTLGNMMNGLMTGAFGGHTTYNVSSVDEAMQLDKNRQNRQALGMVGR